jgi:hypothetical protein
MAAMSDPAHDDHPPEHEPDDAGHQHGHEEHAGHDEHGEHAEPLGPFDWAAWGAGILGIGAGLVVALCLYVATSL